MARIAFIDLEASGLGPASWPIEAGWCFLDGAPTATLIRPAADWSDDAWDEAAEQLHGIARETLTRSGQSPAAVCAALNDALAEATVYSDAPDWDGFWLYRLFSASKVRQRFALHDFAELFDSVPQPVLEAAKRAAEQTAPHCHRAKDDVLHMRTLYNAALAADGD